MVSSDASTASEKLWMSHSAWNPTVAFAELQKRAELRAVSAFSGFRGTRGGVVRIPGRRIAARTVQ